MANTFTTKVAVRGVPVSRAFAVIMKHGDTFEVAGQGRSDEDGDVTVQLNRYKPGCQYFAMAVDEYGDNFVPEAMVEIGDLISPSLPNGFAYEVVTAGKLPATEPAWPTAGAPFAVGSAIVTPVRVFAPSVYGPLPLDITVDEHWASVTLLLIFEGTAGQTVTPVDLSPSGRTIEVVSSTTKYQTGGNPFDPAGATMLAEGSSNNVVWLAPSPSLSFNTDATMEIWFRPMSPNWDLGTTPHEGLVSRRNTTSSNQEWRLNRFNDFVQFVAYNLDGEAVNLQVPVTKLPAGQNHYIAVCRTGSLFEMWVNGIKEAEGTFTGTYAASTATGARVRFNTDYNSRYFNGNIHSFRFTHGVARYSGDTIRVPTMPFYAEP